MPELKEAEPIISFGSAWPWYWDFRTSECQQYSGAKLPGYYSTKTSKLCCFSHSKSWGRQQFIGGLSAKKNSRRLLFRNSPWRKYWWLGSLVHAETTNQVHTHIIAGHYCSLNTAGSNKQNSMIRQKNKNIIFSPPFIIVFVRWLPLASEGMLKKEGEVFH